MALLSFKHARVPRLFSPIVQRCAHTHTHTHTLVLFSFLCSRFARALSLSYPSQSLCALPCSLLSSPALHSPHKQTYMTSLYRTNHCQATASFLRPEETIALDPTAIVLAATRGESCMAACSRSGKRCAPELMQFANDCAKLRTLFPCEAGCGHQVGWDIPCYVADASRDTAKQCLVTDGAVPFKCDAKHEATRRACVCM